MTWVLACRQQRPVKARSAHRTGPGDLRSVTSTPPKKHLKTGRSQALRVAQCPIFSCAKLLALTGGTAEARADSA